MATNTFNRENLFTAAKMTHNQETMDVAEVINESNPLVHRMHVQQANDITSHVVSRRTKLPTPTWTNDGNGWNATTALLQQARETIGTMHDRYACPEDVMRRQPNPAKFRSQQERPHVEAMTQTVANQTYYGDYDRTTGAFTPEPEKFSGLAARYTALSSSANILSGAADASFVLNNGDSSASDDTSIWFIQSGPGKVYYIYPRNSSTVGIKTVDEGRQLVSGDNSVASTSATASNPTNQLWSYITEWTWDIGLCIEDGRAIKRLANISAVLTDSKTLDEDYIIQIRNNFKTMGPIDMYMSEQIGTQLQIRAKDKSNVHWGPEDPFGRPQLMFLDMNIYIDQAMKNDEASLT